MGHVLNEEGPRYKFLKSIELKNGHPHLKEHPKNSKYTKFDCCWFKRKVMFTSVKIARIREVSMDLRDSCPGI